MAPQSPSEDHHPRDEGTSAGDLYLCPVGAGGRSHELCVRPRRTVPARRQIRRQNLQGGQASRSAGGAADQVRAGDQSQDCEGPWPDDPALSAPPRRPGNRVVNRRRFLHAVSVGLLASPLAAEAQQAGKIARVGFLWSGPAPSPEQIAQAPFTVAMRERGWVEGKNLVVERRFGDSASQMLALVAELGRLKVDVLVVFSAGTAAMALRETRDTPIVIFSAGYDLVRAGLVASLARPGGNVTGTQDLQADTFSKRLQLLKELVPNLTRVASLSEVVTTGAISSEERARGRQLYTDTARALGLEAQFFRATRPEDFPTLFVDMVKAGNRGLTLEATPFTLTHRQQISDLAVRHRLPAIAAFRWWPDAGGLISYGTTS